MAEPQGNHTNHGCRVCSGGRHGDFLVDGRYRLFMDGKNADGTERLMSMRWYAVQAFSGFEKSVQRGLEERIARSDLKDMFGQILVPVEEVIEMKAGQKTISERKLYP